MDVSEVKVLARRANGILFVMPVLIILSGFCLVYSILVLKDVIEPNRDTLFMIYLFTFLDRYKFSSFRHAWNSEFIYNFHMNNSFNRFILFIRVTIPFCQLTSKRMDTHIIAYEKVLFNRKKIIIELIDKIITE